MLFGYKATRKLDEECLKYVCMFGGGGVIQTCLEACFAMEVRTCVGQVLSGVKTPGSLRSLGEIVIRQLGR